jgi:DNA-binding NarL/FixJ family response regulator
VHVVIADDEALLREGLVRLLGEVGCEVVGTAATAVELLRVVERTLPDAVLVDIRMPPTHTDEGLVAAREIRARWPHIGVLVMSHFIESRYAMRLLENHPGGSGYLLKHRVSDVGVLADALRRVCDGECVLDPTIVRRLLAKRSRPEPLRALTEREREVLTLMAEGRSNVAVSERLALRPKTVEAHVKSIFTKLGLAESADDHRRVLAVLTYLRSADGGAAPHDPRAQSSAEPDGNDGRTSLASNVTEEVRHGNAT